MFHVTSHLTDSDSFEIGRLHETFGEFGQFVKVHNIDLEWKLIRLLKSKHLHTNMEIVCFK